MKKRIIAAVVALAVGITIFAGCGAEKSKENSAENSNNTSSGESDDQKTDQKTEEAEQDTYKIGISVSSTSDEFCATMIEGIEAAKKESGDKIEVFLVSAEHASDQQLNQIDTWIAQGMDAAIIQPVDTHAISAGISLLNEAGIPVVCMNNKTDSGDYTFVGSSSLDSGKIQGEWVAENAPENATYCYLQVPMGTTAQLERKQGLEEVLKEERTDIEVLSEQCGNAARDEGLKLTEDWIQAYGHFDMLISQNDAMALGAKEALSTAGITDTLICGIDGNREAMEAIQEGTYGATLLQNGYKQGYYSTMMAYWELTKDPQFTGEDYIIPYELITKDNVDEYLALETAEDYIFKDK